MRSTTSFWTTIYDDSSECGSGFITGNEGESSVKKYRVTINSFGKLQVRLSRLRRRTLLKSQAMALT